MWAFSHPQYATEVVMNIAPCARVRRLVVEVGSVSLANSSECRLGRILRKVTQPRVRIITCLCDSTQSDWQAKRRVLIRARTRLRCYFGYDPAKGHTGMSLYGKTYLSATGDNLWASCAGRRSTAMSTATAGFRSEPCRRRVALVLNPFPA